MKYSKPALLPVKLFTAFLLMLLPSAAMTQVGIGTDTPHVSAMLDVSSIDKGVLIPRIALTAANVAAPVTSPAEGLIIYNTAIAGVAPNNVIPGYYYWNGTRWYPVVSKGTNPGDMQYWDGSKWVMIPAATANGKVLTWCNGKPVWDGCADTTVIAPVNNQYEGHILDLYDPNAFVTVLDQHPICAWTSGGNSLKVRCLLRFDYSNIPPGAIIDSARLFLYADPTPINGNLIDAHFGPTNSFYVQRITSTWTLPTPFSWNNPPVATTTNQLVIPQSTSAFQDAVLDVTQLVKDQLQFGNNGFYMRLVNEVIYNSRQYVSSKNADVSRHPKIKIYWHQ
ncbi:MAG: DNRLRE domain-containing protein [Chitinophagaceae bacterium]|nr:DNRLRE domain-containing protein [Chitinophagaceae bacterium]